MAKKIEKTLDKQENPIDSIGKTDIDKITVEVNDINAAIGLTIEMIANDCTINSTDNRLCRFFAWRSIGYNNYQSAIKAGYSNNYAMQGALNKRECPAHMQKAIDNAFDKQRTKFRNSAVMLLPTIRQRDIEFLEGIRGDEEMYVKSQSVINRLTKEAGIQSFDDSGQGNTINIGQIQAYISNNLKLDD